MNYAGAYKIEFDNRRGQLCVVTINKKNYRGECTTLTGAATPFETQEDDDEDVYQTLRGQTGYIRIVTDDVDFIDKIMPATALDELVTVHVDGVLRWQGFVQTEVFTQEWRGGLREVEIPVASLVASLEYTSLPSSFMLGRYSIANIINTLLAQFGCGAVLKSLVRDSFLQYYVQASLFFQSSGENDDTGSAYTSDNGSTILKELLKPFGAVLREEDGVIHLCQYVDNAKFYAYNTEGYDFGTAEEAPQQLTERQFYASGAIDTDGDNHVNQFPPPDDVIINCIPLTKDFNDIEILPDGKNRARTYYNSVSAPFGVHIDVEQSEEDNEATVITGIGEVGILSRLREQFEQEVNSTYWEDYPLSIIMDTLPTIYSFYVNLLIDYYDPATGDEYTGEPLDSILSGIEDFSSGELIARRIYAECKGSYNLPVPLSVSDWRAYALHTWLEDYGLYVVRFSEEIQEDEDGEFYTVHLFDHFTTKIYITDTSGTIEWTNLEDFATYCNYPYGGILDYLTPYKNVIAFVPEEADGAKAFKAYRVNPTETLEWENLPTADENNVITLDRGMASLENTAPARGYDYQQGPYSHATVYRCTSFAPLTVNADAERATVAVPAQEIRIKITATEQALQNYFGNEEEKEFKFVCLFSLFISSEWQWDGGDYRIKTAETLTGFSHVTTAPPAATINKNRFTLNEDGTRSAVFTLNIPASTAETLNTNILSSGFYPVFSVSIPFGEASLIDDVQMKITMADYRQDFEAFLRKEQSGNYVIIFLYPSPTVKKFRNGTPFHLYELEDGAQFTEIPYTYRLQAFPLDNFLKGWRSADHTETRIRPCKLVSVKANLEKYNNAAVFTFPEVEEDDRYVYHKQLNEGMLNVQPYLTTQAEYNEKHEDYKIWASFMQMQCKYKPTITTRFREVKVIRNSTPEEVLTHGVWNERGWDGKDSDGNNIVTSYVGAFPCRWSVSASSQDHTIGTTSGLMLIMIPSNNFLLNQFYHPLVTFVCDEQEYNSGLFCLNFNLLYIGEGRVDHPEFRYKYDKVGKITLCLQIKTITTDMYWNGTAWTSNPALINITIANQEDGGLIETNANSYPNAAGNQGYYFPAHSGRIIVTISAVFAMGFTTSGLFRHFFFSGLSIKHEAEKDKTSMLSTRSANVYTATTNAQEYQEKKNVELKIASFKNNVDSPSLLLNSNAVKNYAGWHFEQTLLDRLRLYYSKIRTVYEIDVEKAPERSTVRSLARVNNRVFVPIVANDDWRECEQHLKLIEAFDA